MKKQGMILSDGWYPKEQSIAKKQIYSYIKDYKQRQYHKPIGAIVPHAGWYFSGKLIAKTILSLDIKNSELIVLFGGHLLENKPILYYDCEAFETPFGIIKQDKKILNIINKKLKRYSAVDSIGDNSIEVILPFIKFFAPDAKIIAFRTPPSKLARILGETIAEESTKRKINTKFIASSDLTHYGPSYDFNPIKNTYEALDWVQKENDKDFIELLENMRGNKAIDHANQNYSACSSGACAACIYACKTLNKNKGNIIDYYTSFHIKKDKNFVGYMGMIF